MVLAIFNPFCCCTAGVLATGDEVGNVPVGHSCCQSQSSDLPLGGDSRDQHDPDKCPHQALKEYQASLVKGDAPAPHAVSLLPALFLVFDLVIFEPMAQSSYATHIETISHAPPLALSQVYCVYRI